jgi:hypothetical protein
MARRKLATDPKAVIMVRKRVGAASWKLRTKGLLSEIPQQGDYKGWQLAL